MRLRHLFMYAPDGEVAQSAVDQTFGPLSTIQPGMAATEEREQERRAKGKEPVIAVEVDRPILDSERPPEKAEEPNGESKKPEAAREAPPATDSKESGSDPESPDDEQAVLDALVEKYQGNPKSMAKAIRGIRSLQTKTAEERKTIEEQFEAVVKVIEEDYDLVDGKPVLKPEVASRALRTASPRPRGPSTLPTEAEVRAQVEAEFAKQALEIVDEDQVPAVLAKFRPLIDKQASDTWIAAKAQHDAYHYHQLAEVGAVVDRQLREHPNDKEILPEVDALYGGVPEEHRTKSVTDGWFPFDKVCELVRIKHSLPQMIKEAYELGKKHRGQAVNVTESGSPGRSRPTPPNGRRVSSEVERSMKDDIIKSSSGLPSIDSILA